MLATSHLYSATECLPFPDESHSSSINFDNLAIISECGLIIIESAHSEDIATRLGLPHFGNISSQQMHGTGLV
jgi:hypothetical protein